MEGGIGWWCLFGQLHLGACALMKSEGAGVVNNGVGQNLDSAVSW